MKDKIKSESKPTLPKKKIVKKKTEDTKQEGDNADATEGTEKKVGIKGLKSGGGGLKLGGVKPKTSPLKAALGDVKKSGPSKVKQVKKE